jgi:hypothetical protein
MSEPAGIDKVLKALGEIRSDVEQDVARREGMPFTGATVGEALGEICAQIDGLAGCMKVLAQHIQELKRGEG